MPSACPSQERRLACATFLKRVLLPAIVLVLLQLSIALTFAHPKTMQRKYLSLNQWDSRWYSYIATQGYKNAAPPMSGKPGEANLTFMPGYPAVASAVQRVSGFPIRVALLVTAQVSAVGFWMYFLLLCRLWKFPRTVTAFTMGAILSFPTAFYFVSGYGESFFCMNLLGLLYWSRCGKPRAWIPAAIHGFLLSATRIVGATLAFVPLLWFRDCRTNKSSLRMPFAWFVAVATASGTLLYFAYVHVVFGDWHLPFELVKAPGWNIRVNYGGVFDLRKYALFVPKIVNGVPSTQHLGRMAYPVFLGLLLTSLCCEGILAIRNRSRGFSQRAGMYAAFAMLWFVYMGATYTNTISAIRYMLPLYILLCLCLGHMVARSRSSTLPAALQLLVPIILVVSAIVQTAYIAMFTAGKWIA